ncbi:putative bifunctional diguanylate cyclase/phosphodiesterase [Motilibacter deserti]|uniref:Bifunctional diguanylate cyclase/phosphodiesterase n=1 Tax=Motilibacter deserti TaxID=2714956 RepID=A0ABX0GUT7_9ACTN|nr:bifunctional diguanylate cyclase/phosphodiesterase [Motilibacter deserti]NHC13053.1 bifunctional diguanylate cyclase/phosphodiesterase [Motilibacter deserti]
MAASGAAYAGSALTAGRTGSAGLDVLAGALALVTVVTACTVLWWRASRVREERDVWHRLALAFTAAGAGVVVARLLGALGLGDGTLVEPMTAGSVVACVLIYQGLIRWNRHRTAIADPGDWLNGVSAAFALIAIGNLVLARLDGPFDGWTGWETQPWLVRGAVGFVAVGTAASLSALGGLLRDRRLWLVTAGLAAAFAGDLSAGLLAASEAGPRSAGSEAGWVLAAVLVAACALRRPIMVDARPTTPGEPTVGALVVLLAGTLTLGVMADQPLTDPAVWFAMLAVLGVSVRVLGDVRSLTELAQTRMEARTDDVTGTANRRALVRRLDGLTAAGEKVSLVLLDLDRFKEVNEALGHDTGDDLLKAAASRMADALPEGCILGRLSSDEFLIVVPGAHDRAQQLAQQVQAAASGTYELHGTLVDVHVTGGLASFPLHASTSSGLLRCADSAVREAKQRGWGLAVFDEDHDRDVNERARTLEQLRALLPVDGSRPAQPRYCGELVLHYQPQLDVTDSTIVGVEALARWQHPERGLVAPLDFLGLVERYGLVRPLTLRVLDMALAQARAWREGGRPLRVAVNLSATSLLDSALPDEVGRLLAEHGVPASDLQLEITETAVMSDSVRARAVVAALAGMGVSLSIDDYGTGYSSLAYLRDLDVDELKLDRSFVSDIVSDPRSLAIVSSTVALAHSLGLRLVAEGVEDAATLDMLAGLGCDVSQGFFHSRPIPACELESWLGRHAREAARAEEPVPS